MEAVGEPVHGVGHSWGAHRLLAALLAERIEPLSVVFFEATPLFAKLIDGRFRRGPELEDMVNRFEPALAFEDPEAAAIIIDVSHVAT